MIVKKIIYETLKPLLIFYLIANGLAFPSLQEALVSWHVLENKLTLIVGLITSIPTMTLITLPLGEFIHSCKNIFLCSYCNFSSNGLVSHVYKFKFLCFLF